MSSVSIIIPAHNRPDLVVKAVASALAQTVSDIEVLVVDDGSVPPLSRGLFPSDDRIRLIRLDDNRKAAFARNVGLESASKEWVAYLDSDDIWMPHKLDRQLALAATIPPEAMIAIATGWTYVGEEHARQSLVPRRADSIDDFASGCWFCPGATVMMRRRDALRVGPQDVALARLEDFDWFLRFAQRGGTLQVVPEALADIRWHRSLDVASVQRASRIIQSKYCRASSPLFVASSSARRNIRSYLALTVASAAWYNGRRVTALAALLRSWLLHPRWSAQLARHWVPIEGPRRAHGVGEPNESGSAGLANALEKPGQPR